MLLTTALRLFFRIPGPGILYIRFAPGTSQELCCPYPTCSFFHALESALVGLPVCGGPLLKFPWVLAYPIPGP